MQRCNNESMKDGGGIAMDELWADVTDIDHPSAHTVDLLFYAERLDWE